MARRFQFGFAIAAIGCGLWPASALGQVSSHPTTLNPRTITLKSGAHNVANILLELDKQTGNRVTDRRMKGAPGKIAIGFSGETFWQALDLLADKLGSRLSLYGEAGIALADGQRKAGTVAYAGSFRLEVKNLAVQRDVEADQRTCVVHVEVAWEPRLEPLYLTVDGVRGGFARDNRGKELAFGPQRGVAQSVAQRRAQMVELRLPGPERSSPSLQTLAGQLKVISPARMLTASFDKLATGKQDRKFTDDGVSVYLKNVVANAQRWSFDLEIENPEETPTFESFQSWLDNNRIHLERVVSGKKEIWTPPPDDWLAGSSRRTAQIRYNFAGAQGKGGLGAWTLVYRTPGRIVEQTIPFEFRNIDLP
jgi:hypothetical protein